MPDLGYIVDPIEVDETQQQLDAYAYLQVQWPEWVPSDSDLIAWVIAAVSRLTSSLAETASDVPPAIFRYFGSSILGINPVDATSATVSSTWTLNTNPAGQTILAGTMVAIPDVNGNLYAFEVTDDVVLPAGTMTTTGGGVSLRALDTGPDANGLGGSGVVVDLIDPIAWVATVTLTGATTGGADAEADQDYLNRLSARLTLLTPRPILPRDYEVLARDEAQQNGVDVRVLALDGYNPADNTFGNERMITIVMIGVDGTLVSGTVKTAVDDSLQAQREVNFVVNIIDPTLTSVAVTFEIVVLPGFDSASVLQSAIDAVTNFLEPSNWGQPQSQGLNWIQSDTVRRQDVSTVINNVPGVDYWTTLTIGIGAGAQTTDESQTLPGAAPLATPGIITGTVA